MPLIKGMIIIIKRDNDKNEFPCRFGNNVNRSAKDTKQPNIKLIMNFIIIDEILPSFNFENFTAFAFRTLFFLFNSDFENILGLNDRNNPRALY